MNTAVFSSTLPPEVVHSSDDGVVLRIGELNTKRRVTVRLSWHRVEQLRKLFAEEAGKVAQRGRSYADFVERMGGVK